MSPSNIIVESFAEESKVYCENQNFTIYIEYLRIAGFLFHIRFPMPIYNNLIIFDTRKNYS